MCRTPIVLDVGERRSAVPITGRLDRELVIFLRIAEQEVGKIVSTEGPVESKAALCGGEVVLHL